MLQSLVIKKICRDLPTNINRSDYSFALEKLHPGTAENDEAFFDPNLPLQLKKRDKITFNNIYKTLLPEISL